MKIYKTLDNDLISLENVRRVEKYLGETEKHTCNGKPYYTYNGGIEIIYTDGHKEIFDRISLDFDSNHPDNEHKGKINNLLDMSINSIYKILSQND